MIATHLLLAYAAPHKTRPWRIYFVDVRYGDAIFMELPFLAGGLLLDAGSAKHASRLIAFLKAKDIHNIHTAIITHPHENHFGGLREVALQMPIGRLLHNGDSNAQEGYASLLNDLQHKKIPTAILRRTQSIKDLSIVTLDVLNPPDLSGSPNDDAIVLWIKYGKTSVLFLSDVGMQRQKELLRLFPEIRQADCVQIPHHGGPLSDEFIEAFQGKIFIVSTGPNPWGTPHEERLEQLGGTIYRTDRDGTVMIESNGHSLKVSPWTANN